MSIVDVQFVVNGNFEQFTAEVKAANAALAQLSATSGKLAATTRMNEVLTNFRQGMSATNAFEHSLVNVTSEAERFGQALGKNSLSMRQAATAASQFRRSGDGVIRSLAQQQLAVENSVAAFRRMPDGRVMAETWRPLNLAVNDFASAQKLAAMEASILNQTLRDQYTQLVNSGKNMQWAGRQISMGLTFPIVALGAASAKVFYDMDQQLTRITKVYGTNAQQMSLDTDELRGNMLDLADQMNKTYAQSGGDTLGLAADIAALGKTGADLNANVAATTRLATLGEIDRQEAMKATLSLQSAFKLSNDELAKSINFLNGVENSTSATLQDLVEAIPRAGPVVQGLGGDVQDLAMYMVAMREGGIGAAEGANALKSGLGSIIAPSGDATDFLKKLGINMKEIVNKNAGDLTGTIINLKAELDDLTSVERQQALVKLFGKYQYARMGALFNNIGEQGSQTQQVEKIAAMGADTLSQAADREIKRTTESASGQFRMMINDLQLQLVSMGKTILPIFTNIGKFISGVLGAFNKLPDGVNTLIIAIAAAAAMVGPIVMTLGVLKNFYGTFMKGLVGVREFIQRRFMGMDVRPYQHMTAEMKASQMYTKELEATFAEATSPTKIFTSEIQQLTMALQEMSLQSMEGIGTTNSLVSELYSRGSAGVVGAMSQRVRDLNIHADTRGVFLGTSSALTSEGRGTNNIQGGRSYTPAQLAALGPERLAAQRSVLMGLQGQLAGGKTMSQIIGKSQGQLQAEYNAINEAIRSGKVSADDMKVMFDQWQRDINSVQKAMAATTAENLAMLRANPQLMEKFAAENIGMSEATVLTTGRNSEQAVVNRLANQGAAGAAGLREGMGPEMTAALMGPQRVSPFTNLMVDGMVPALEHVIGANSKFAETMIHLTQIEQQYGISLQTYKEQIVQKIGSMNRLGVSEEEVTTMMTELQQGLAAVIPAMQTLDRSFVTASETLLADIKEMDLNGIKLTDIAARKLTEEFNALAGETGDSLIVFEQLDASGKKFITAVNRATGEMSSFSIGAKGGATAVTERGMAARSSAVSNQMFAQTRAILDAQLSSETKIAELRQRGLLLEDDKLAIETGELGIEEQKVVAAREQLDFEMQQTIQDREQAMMRAGPAAPMNPMMPGGVPGSSQQGFFSRNAGKIGMGGFAAAMGMSMLPVSGNPLLAGVQGSANMAMLGGSVGMMFGPEGAGIGAGLGAIVGGAQSFYRYISDKNKEAAMEIKKEFEDALAGVSYEIDPNVGKDFGVNLERQTMGAYSMLNAMLQQRGEEVVTSAFEQSVRTDFADLIEQMKNAGNDQAATMAKQFYANLLQSGMPRETARAITQSVIRESEHQEIELAVTAVINKVKNKSDARALTRFENNQAINDAFGRLDEGDLEDRAREVGALEGQALLDGLGKNSDPRDLMDKFWKMVHDVGAHAADQTGTQWGELFNGSLKNVFMEGIKDDYGLTGRLQSDIKRVLQMTPDMRSEFLDRLSHGAPQAAEMFQIIIDSTSTAARTINEKMPPAFQRLFESMNLGMNGASAFNQVMMDIIGNGIDLVGALNTVGAAFAGTFPLDLVTVSEKDIKNEKDAMDKWVKQQQRQADARKSAIDDERDALSSRQDALQHDQDKMNREFDQQERAVNKHYDSEVKAIQREENAIERQDQKRQEAFQHEQERMQKMQELRNNAISIREAVSEGNLYEAARLRIDREAMRRQNAAENAQTAADRRSQRRTRQLEQQRRDLEHQRREELRGINQQRREEQKRFNEHIRHIQRELDALDDEEAAIDDHLDWVENRARQNVKDLNHTRDEQVNHEKQVQQQLADIWNNEQTTMIRKWKETYSLLGNLDKEQAKAFIRSWETAFGKMPDEARKKMMQALQSGSWDEVTTRIGKLLGIPGQDLQSILKLARNPTFRVTVGANGNVQVRGGTRQLPNAKDLWTGGYVMGKGGATSDTVPINASNGEFVIKQPVVQRHGKGFFDAINSGKPIDNFASGGMVHGKGYGGMIDVARGAMSLTGSEYTGVVSAAATKMEGIFKAAKAFANRSAKGRYVPGAAGKYGGTTLDAEQLKNAATIMSVGRNLNMSRRDLVVGIMTALQESMLRNVRYGTYDSLGLFQQRASWGSAQQRLNPKYASRQFFMRLRQIPDRDDMALWQEAQAVQISAYPRAYAQWSDEARAIVGGSILAGGGGRRGGSGYTKPFVGNWPISRTFAQHDYHGLDIAMPEGTPLRALTTGRLKNQDYAFGSYGNWYSLNSGGKTFVYAHLSRDRAGSGLVPAGTVIGYSGTTGNSTGPHLHLEARLGGNYNNQVDPQKLGIPGLKTGGTVRFDNTLANLHKGERVLTEPLTKRFDDALGKIASGGGDNYNFEVNVINPKDDMDIEKAVGAALDKRDAKLGRLRVVSGGRSR